jgi:hypothetical protein
MDVPHIILNHMRNIQKSYVASLAYGNIIRAICDKLSIVIPEQMKSDEGSLNNLLDPSFLTDRYHYVLDSFGFYVPAPRQYFNFPQLGDDNYPFWTPEGPPARKRRTFEFGSGSGSGAQESMEEEPAPAPSAAHAPPPAPAPFTFDPTFSTGTFEEVSRSYYRSSYET